MRQKPSKPEELVKNFNIEQGWAGHQWRQQGPYLVCKSCDLEHSTYIGINKMLVGFDKEGKPKFIRR